MDLFLSWSLYHYASFSWKIPLPSYQIFQILTRVITVSKARFHGRHYPCLRGSLGSMKLSGSHRRVQFPNSDFCLKAQFLLHVFLEVTGSFCSRWRGVCQARVRMSMFCFPAVLFGENGVAAGPKQLVLREFPPAAGLPGLRGRRPSFPSRFFIFGISHFITGC